MHRYIGRLFLAALLTLVPAATPVVARAQTDGEYTVIISEVGWAGSSLSSIDEWLELTNLTEEMVDVGGWTIAGAATSGGTVTIPEGSAIAPHQSFLISNYANDDAKSALGRAPDLVTTSLSLSNSALALVLRDESGAPRDAAGDGAAPLAGGTAGGSGGDAGGDVGTGTASMVRAAPVANGTSAASWTTATARDGFDDGYVELGTPGTIEQWFAPLVEETTEVAVEETPADVVEASEAVEEITAEEVVEVIVHDVAIEEVETEPIADEPAETVEEDIAEDPALVETTEPVAEPAPTPTINYPGGTLVINELVSDAAEEWIEIYNPYNNVIPLAEWTVRDASGKATALPEQLLGWDQYVVVRNPLGKLNNDGDTVELVDPNGIVIDAMSYGTADVPAADDPGSLTRDGDGNWRVTTTATPGSANVLTVPVVVEIPKPVKKPAAKKAATKTTKAAETTKEPPPVETWSGPATLRLSELYPNTSGGDLVEEFVEVENTGDTVVDLKGWTLNDASDRAHRFDASLKVNPGELLTLTRAETRLALNNTTDAVTLIAPDGSVIDTQSYESPPKGSSLVRSDAQWVWTRTPTPDEQNVVSKDDEPGPEDPRPAAAKTSAARVASASGNRRSVTTRVEGTVLVGPGVLGKQIFYVQTETGGLQVYKYDAAFPDLSPGDRVAVSGTMTENRGEARLKVGSGNQIALVASEDAPMPEETTIASLTNADHGRLVRVSGTVLSRSGAKATVEDAGAKLDVRVADGTGIDRGLLARGAPVTITGILVATESGITLLPRSTEDIVVATPETQTEALSAATVSGKDAQNARDRTMSLLITTGVIAGLGLYSSRRLIRAGKLWYAKTRALRAAAQAAH